MVRKAKLEMKKTNIKKLTVTAGFVAIAVIGSLFSVPVFGSKCAPIQSHLLCLPLVFSSSRVFSSELAVGASGCQSVGASASASGLPVSIQG